MQLFQILSVLAVATFSTAAALNTRGGIPCSFSKPGAYEPCPPEHPTCVRFPSSCTANCAGICV
jgi:hypothetical protein